MVATHPRSELNLWAYGKRAPHILKVSPNGSLDCGPLGLCDKPDHSWSGDEKRNDSHCARVTHNEFAKPRPELNIRAYSERALRTLKLNLLGLSSSAYGARAVSPTIHGREKIGVSRDGVWQSPP